MTYRYIVCVIHSLLPLTEDLSLCDLQVPAFQVQSSSSFVPNVEEGTRVSKGCVVMLIYCIAVSYEVAVNKLRADIIKFSDSIAMQSIGAIKGMIEVEEERLVACQTQDELC